jgi:hypothetical protein
LSPTATRLGGTSRREAGHIMAEARGHAGGRGRAEADLQERGCRPVQAAAGRRGSLGDAAGGLPVEGGEGDGGAVLPHPRRGGPELHGPGQPDAAKLSWMRWSGSAGTWAPGSCWGSWQPWGSAELRFDLLAAGDQDFTTS